MLIVGFVVIQTIVFGIIYYFLRKLMLQDTTSAVNRLKLVDEENVKRLEDTKRQIQEADAEYKKKTQELKTELARQKEEAKKQIDEEREKVLAKAREDGDRVLEAAKHQAEKVDQEIEKGVRERAVVLAQAIVEKALSETMKNALHEKLVEELLREIEGLDAGSIPADTKEMEILQPQPLPAEQKRKIQAVLEKKLGRKLEVKDTLKKEIGSGLSLKLGSVVLDGSLKNVLGDAARELRKQES